MKEIEDSGIIAIGDYRHVLFFEVLGMPGKIADNSIEAYGILQKELSKKGSRVIILSKKQSIDFPEDITEINLSGNKIVFEMPDPEETESKSIADKIMSILGVSSNENK